MGLFSLEPGRGNGRRRLVLEQGGQRNRPQADAAFTEKVAAGDQLPVLDFQFVSIFHACASVLWI